MENIYSRQKLQVVRIVLRVEWSRVDGEESEVKWIEEGIAAAAEASSGRRIKR